MARRNQGPRLKWHRSGSGWYICWNEAGRYFERSTGTKDSEEAQIVFAEWMQTRQRKHGPSDPAKTLVTDVLNCYASKRGVEVLGKETLGNAVANLANGFEGMTLAEMPDHLATYRKKRGCADSTMRRELGVLRSAINYAFKHRIIIQPVAFDLPPESPARERWLTETEAQKLLDAATFDPDAALYLPLFILVALYTGRRAEAIMSLRWEKIDLNGGTINFEIDGRKRTKKRRGICPIVDELRPHLEEAKRRGTDIGPVFHINGRPIKSVRKAFENACRRAGIAGVSRHTLKHTAITWAMQTGKSSPWELSGFFATTEKTMERYAHHHPDYQANAVAAVGSKRFRVISR
jgi:integrase